MGADSVPFSSAALLVAPCLTTRVLATGGEKNARSDYPSRWWNTYPSEKYEFVNWIIILNIWKNQTYSKPPSENMSENGHSNKQTRM